MSSIRNWIGANILITVSILANIFLGIAQVKKGIRKRLEFIELQKGEVINISHKSYKNNLTITYGEKKVGRLSNYTFKLKNIGNKAIEVKDFIDESLQIVFDNECEIIGYDIAYSSPKSLKKTLVCGYEKGIFSIQPFILNLNESFEVRIVLDGEISEASLEARLKDTEIIRSKFQSKVLALLLIFLIMMLINAILMYLNGEATGRDPLTMLSSSFYANIRFQIGIWGTFIGSLLLYFCALMFIAHNKDKESSFRQLFKRALLDTHFGLGPSDRL